jgi:hypothetical protein
LENSALIDSKYQLGVEPRTSEAVDEHPDIKAVDAALARGKRGTSDKKIMATFIGRFKCTSSPVSRRHRILDIERIERLIVTPR